MTPGNVVTPNDHAEVEEEEEEELMPEDLTPEQVKAKQKALMDAAVIGDANSKIDMDRLKNDEDNDGGLSEAFGKFLLVLDPTGTVRRRLWTRADFMHIHAISGGYFLFLGIPWLIYSHVLDRVEKYTPWLGCAELGKHRRPCARSMPQPQALQRLQNLSMGASAGAGPRSARFLACAFHTPDLQRAGHLRADGDELVVPHLAAALGPRQRALRHPHVTLQL